MQKKKKEKKMLRELWTWLMPPFEQRSARLLRLVQQSINKSIGSPLEPSVRVRRSTSLPPALISHQGSREARLPRLAEKEIVGYFCKGAFGVKPLQTI